jgi:hypothetical protein
MTWYRRAAVIATKIQPLAIPIAAKTRGSVRKRPRRASDAKIQAAARIA